MELITKSVLRAKRACAIQVAIFAKEWPYGVTPSLEACHRAAVIGLSLDWFAKNMLSAPALAAYQAACATAGATYDAACTPARAAYDAACAPAQATYNAACAPALWDALQI